MLQGVRDMVVKIDRHGQASVLTSEEIELLFNEGLQSDRDRTLFGVCLFSACRIAEACSLLNKDVYATNGRVRSELIIRKANTKGKLGTRTIPVIEDLRSLLGAWQSNAGATYLFPGRHLNHHWKHLHPESASHILAEAFSRVGMEGFSTHSFRRTALTQMSNAGIPLRVIQKLSGHRSLAVLQEYLEVGDAQVRGAANALSALGYVRKHAFTDEEPEFPRLPLIQPPEHLKNHVVDFE
jgi:integrase/recombinase XerD